MGEKKSVKPKAVKALSKPAKCSAPSVAAEPQPSESESRVKARRRKRGAGSRAKHQKKRTEIFHQKAAQRRKRDLDCRCPEGDDDENGDYCRVSPFLFHRSHGTTNESAYQLEICPLVLQFYLENPRENQYVELRDGANIADKLGTNPEQKGLFAKKVIPRGTLICPYVGELYDEQPKRGAYVLELLSEFYLDPEFDTHDLGYLWHLDPKEAAQIPCPPNYARYVNTIYPGDEVSYHYNCSFDPDSGGYLVCWVVALEDIQPGEELLVDYGKFYLRK